MGKSKAKPGLNVQIDSLLAKAMNGVEHRHLKVERNSKDIESFHFEINSNGGFVIAVERVVAEPVNARQHQLNDDAIKQKL